MDSDENIFEEAIGKLKEVSGLSACIKAKWLTKAPSLSIKNEKFMVKVVPNITEGNKGITLSFAKELAVKSGLPSLIVANNIPQKVANEYVSKAINFLDVAGNCHIKGQSLFIQIEGKKKTNIGKTNRARAFQESGIKLIFELLNNPEAINYTYRRLAQVTDISLGSVASIIQELIDLRFILKTKEKIILKNTKALLERWVVAYHDVLRPRLLVKRMRFITPENQKSWKALPIQKAKDVVLWGGEPGASLLTNYLSPAIFTIYNKGSWQGLVKDMKLVPSENGEIEVLKLFWKDEEKYDKQIVSPLLIYADLMGSGIDRNIETAKLILENELSYIK